MSVRYEADGAVVTVTIDRPEVRNAVDSATAAALVACFERFDADPALNVAVLTGAGGTFCAGFDLKEMASGRGDRLGVSGQGPMGPTRMRLGKPVIAAIEGFVVAGGLELALWCDLRVAAPNATFGVFNRRFGVPLIDLGTIRLPRIVGQGRALDMILTGRAVSGTEAMAIGLVDRIADQGMALASALQLAREIAGHPQGALRADRLSALAQWGLPFSEAVDAEYRAGVDVISSGESEAGAKRFAEGQGRHGTS